MGEPEIKEFVHMKKTNIVSPANFVPREYQVPILEAFDNGARFIDIVMHRRAGKDKTCIAIVAKAMLEKVGGYYYVFPEFNQGRKALWDNMDKTGFRTLKHIPEELWSGINSQQMKLELKNGSYLQIVGSNDVDSLVGSNPLGLVFSEWSLQIPKALEFLEPIVNENKGWEIFNYTPRGNNHARKFHEEAIRQMESGNKEWFSYTATAKDTGVFNDKELEDIRKRIMIRRGDDALFQQEYMCSFESPIIGAYYGTQYKVMQSEGRIGKVEWNPDLLVYTAWDLGATDNTVIIFFQKPGDGKINIIDHYEMYGAGMAHFRDILNSKPYDYSIHYLPHDGRNKQQGKEEEVVTRAMILEGMVKRGEMKGRIEIVDQQGKFGIMDGIQKVRSMFYRFSFDEKKCERLLQCIKEYHAKQKKTKFDDEDGDIVKGIMPDHDHWSSHSCFIAGTKILTDEGNINIEDININDKVWTPLGYQKVLSSGVTKISEDIITIKVRSGEILKCTPGHPIFTNRGIVQADALRYNDVIWKQIDLSKLNFKESPTNFRDVIMLHPQVYGRNTATYIERFGDFIMEKFQRVSIFITKTAIASIMTYRILNVSQGSNIYQGTPEKVNGWEVRKIENNSLKLQSQSQKNGMHQRKGMIGTQNMQKNNGKIINKLKEIVTSVIKSTKHLFLRDQSSVARVVKLSRTGLHVPVYNLTVENHHCYLANGLLVSNCDALRMLAISYEEPKVFIDPNRFNIPVTHDSW